MGELRASCVARVRVKDRTGQLRRVGSGYLITPAAVLTAAHVLAGASAQDGPDYEKVPCSRQTVLRCSTKAPPASSPALATKALRRALTP